VKNFVQEGHILSVTAPDGTDDVGGNAGDGVLVGSLFGVAENNFDAGGGVEIMVVGVFALAKATPEAWAQGAPVYWDDTAKKATVTAGGNKLIGVATVAAGSTSITGRVRLNGVALA
jgi:predicted RecA/RadA family phage recombinase